MQSAALSLVIAFIGYSLLNITQAGQKIGLARRAENRVRGWIIWIAATAGTSVAFFVILGAISLGSISLVGAMAGTGLASLAVFSYFVMGERLRVRGIIALVVIIGGAVLVGLFAENTPGGAVRKPLLWGILAGGSSLYIIACLVTGKRSFAGAVIGGFSGFLGAYSQVFQEYGTTSASIADGVGPFLLSLVTNPITLVWVGLSVVSMIVLQFSYKHGPAIRIIPTFTGNFIVVPVVGGVLIFGQTLLLAQWVGVGLIAIGAVALAGGAKKTGA
jgi:drug/metabolite transporter (DMT)-like permease